MTHLLEYIDKENISIRQLFDRINAGGEDIELMKVS